MARRAYAPGAYRAVFYRLLECDDAAAERPVARMVILGAPTLDAARDLAFARFRTTWPQAALLGGIFSVEIERLPASDGAASRAASNRRRPPGEQDAASV